MFVSKLSGIYTYNYEQLNIHFVSISMSTRVCQISGQIKFEEEYSVIRCRDPTFNIKS